jgi:hypothetical protein
MKTPRGKTIQESTASYETWLGKQVALEAAGLERKHELMRGAAFPFLRATYYRWAELWPRLAAEGVRGGREVLAVGDLHVENFGTWRDAEGRLLWGINDFDEASWLPYTHDLVRLAVSVRLAIAAGSLEVPAAAALAALLTGYREGLEAEGRPIVLAEGWEVLRRIAIDKAAHPEKFWVGLDGLPAVAAELVPGRAVKAIAGILPSATLALRYPRRTAGVGSLGRPRFVAIGEWCGGQIAREAKAVARSAVFWAHGGQGEPKPKELMRAIESRAVRCRDPFLEIKRRFTARRLAPDCTKIELADLPREAESARLLYAMGWETANVHLGSATAAALLVDLASRPDDWLAEPVEAMLVAVQEDWEAWSAAEPKRKQPAKAAAKETKTVAAKAPKAAVAKGPAAPAKKAAPAKAKPAARKPKGS